jgi:uncharacterized protein YbcC (UPF0753/DUF2309 family)
MENIPFTVDQSTISYNELEVLHKLKHFLPAQAPLKDFIHHNTLHAFQDLKFEDAILRASKIFGYSVYLPLDEYRSLYSLGRINKDILEKNISEHKGAAATAEWKEKLLIKPYDDYNYPRIGSLRSNWKRQYHIDLDALIHPTLFRILCCYLDQGIAMWKFPVSANGFLASLREMERNDFSSFFKNKRAALFLLDQDCTITDLLKIVVGDSALYEQYLFDQQFAHPGWSGMVSVIEDHPESMVDPRQISLHNLVFFELLLEIDALDTAFKENWLPLSRHLARKQSDLFAPVQKNELDHVLALWQQAFEWTYYDQVLAGLQQQKEKPKSTKISTFQGLFCLDDREGSLRRYLEQLDPDCETFGTPGFFGVEFYFKPHQATLYTRQCPATSNPKHLIREVGYLERPAKDLHFSKPTNSLFRGWIISQTLGFWAGFRLFLNVFSPSLSRATTTSFSKMDKTSWLSVENIPSSPKENGLQIGYTIEEMTERVQGLLKSIGLIKDFASIVYVIGHGSSSVNNTHYSAYDCGACSGKPGTVNARVFAFMANHLKVRELLALKGLFIPTETQFVAALHDTTRDDVAFFGEELLTAGNLKKHRTYRNIFIAALDLNAKERSRRFELINTKESAEKVHRDVRARSVSLFEPRPELNHATNAICIIAPRNLSRGLFLDRRLFMNSYDYKQDPDGKYLHTILEAAAPVCGGINLEYFFSRMDNQKLGAGSKLPHNVMGLFGVANGIDGDLRTGLPSQMIEVHDPVRLLMVVEHFQDVVLKAIQQSDKLYEWFANEWIHLIVVSPHTKALFRLVNGGFIPYNPCDERLETISNITPLLESRQENFPVYLIS